ncbi:class I glutamine amidotransferase-like protein [Agrocybe pediades]|nr:class I glutamine amidotransferase-like protein [Agrocybe pediades]
MPSVLLVMTSIVETLTGRNTGFALPEAARPYYTFIRKANVDFASPKGANPPVDHDSVKKYANESDPDSARFMTDPEVKKKLQQAKKLTEVRVEDYDAIFYPGGHGPVIDLAVDPANKDLCSKFWNQGKVVSAVCHGASGLVSAIDEKTGKSILAGRRMTTFTNEEEGIYKQKQDVPFLIEDKVKELGALLEKADAPFGVKVVTDGKLVTGQNPPSAKPTAEAVLKALGVGIN